MILSPKFGLAINAFNELYIIIRFYFDNLKVNTNVGKDNNNSKQKFEVISRIYTPFGILSEGKVESAPTKSYIYVGNTQKKDPLQEIKVT